MLNVWNRPYNVILKCLRGLEHNLFEELQSFGINRNSLLKFNRGVTVLGCNLQQLYFLSYFPRLATRVYFEAGKVSLLDKEKLFNGCEKIQWLDFINTGNSYLINCSILGNNSNINSKKYACQLVKDGINKHFSSNLNIEPPTISFKQPEIQLDIEVDEECNATILVDSVGSSLSNRGYRYKPNITDTDPTMASSILYDMGYSSFTNSPYSIIEYEKLCNESKNNVDLEINKIDLTKDISVSVLSKFESESLGSKLISNSDSNLSELSTLSNSGSLFESTKYNDTDSKSFLNSNPLNQSKLKQLQNPSIVDLFSGCGVFLIEASLMASRIPPGYFRDYFTFQKFPKFDVFSFQMLKKYTDCRKIKHGSEEWNSLKGKFIGIERDWEKLESSVVSSETAGTLELMSFNQADYLKDGLIDSKKENKKKLDKDKNNEKKMKKDKESSSKGEKDKGWVGDEEDNKWKYMIAKLPKMKRLDILDKNNDDKDRCRNKFVKNNEKNTDNLSYERYITLLKSLSKIRSKYFSPDSKGVIIVPSFIDKNQVQESFNSTLRVGKTFNKDGIDSTAYYTM